MLFRMPPATPTSEPLAASAAPTEIVASNPSRGFGGAPIALGEGSITLHSDDRAFSGQRLAQAQKILPLGDNGVSLLQDLVKLAGDCVALL